MHALGCTHVVEWDVYCGLGHRFQFAAAETCYSYRVKSVLVRPVDSADDVRAVART